MGLAENIRRYREAAGLDQTQLAKKVDRTNGAISQWESGKATPRMPMVKKLADLFGCTISELMGEESAVVGAPVPAGYRRLPVAVAGHAGEFADEPEPGEFVDVPESVLDAISDPDAYIIRVRGNCMSRRFPDQSNAVASPRCEPRNGDAVVAECNGELIIREYFRGANTLVLSPDSYDEGYEDIVFDDPDCAEVCFQGVIKWYQASTVRRY